jgi:hypothetical protein
MNTNENPIEIIEITNVEAANAAHVGIETFCHQATATAVAIGRYLISVKASLKHGEFGKWVKENCIFSARTGEDYRRIADAYKPDMKHLPIRDILKQVRQPAKRKVAKGSKPEDGEQGDEQSTDESDEQIDGKSLEAVLSSLIRTYTFEKVEEALGKLKPTKSGEDRDLTESEARDALCKVIKGKSKTHRKAATKAA